MCGFAGGLLGILVAVVRSGGIMKSELLLVRAHFYYRIPDRDLRISAISL